MEVAPFTEQNVPVKMTVSSLRMPTADWLFNSKNLAKGVFTARVLLPGTDTNAAVRIVNTTPEKFILTPGTELGNRHLAVLADQSPSCSSVSNLCRSST